MAKADSRIELLSAAINVVRAKGYASTRVDDLAEAAGVTKGSFFHHFSTKEACASEAVKYWSDQAEVVFAACGHRVADSSASRILAYIDFRIALLEGPVASYTCYAGTLLQEVHETHPELASLCATSILGHAKTLESDLAQALGTASGEAHDLAVHIQAAIQGSLIIAKAEGGSHGARASLGHLRRYLELRMENQSNDQ